MDLPFAIDGLYSAGWWPADTDPCIQAPDGRWYPDQAAVESLFERAGADLNLDAPAPGRACRARWTAPQGRHGSVIADDRTAAGLLALAELIRSRPARTVVTG